MNADTRRRWYTVALGLIPTVLVLVFVRNDPDRRNVLFSALIGGLLLAPVVMGLCQRRLARKPKSPPRLGAAAASPELVEGPSPP